MNAVQTKLGKAVRAARKTRGWSQEDLAGQTGLDRTYISGIERGVRNPTISSIARIADALGLSIHELVRPLADADS